MDDPSAILASRPNGETPKARGPSISATACDQCYRCKVRCSGARDACDRCVQNGSICTFSLGKPLGKPPKSSRGRVPRNKPQPAKRLRDSPDDDAHADSFENPGSPSSSSSGRKRRRLGAGDGDMQQLLDPNPNRSSDGDTDRPPYPPALVAEAPRAPPQPPLGDGGEGNGEAELLTPINFDMDMSMDLDFGMNFESSHFSFLVDSSRSNTPPPQPALATARQLASAPASVLVTERQRTPAPPPALGKAHQHTPAPIVTTRSGFSINTSPPLITPPSSLSSAVEPSPSTSPPQLWTPDFLQLASDLYTAPYATDQRFDKTLLLARKGLDVIVSCLPNPDYVMRQRLGPPSSPLACVLLAQQVLANYRLLRSQILLRLRGSCPTGGTSSVNSSPISASFASVTNNAIVAIGEGVCVGGFEVEGLESQCHVVEAIVNVEMERLKKVLFRLEKWSGELAMDGKGEGKLASLILGALNKHISVRS